MFSIRPPPASTFALMQRKTSRACALKSPRCSGPPSLSYATWPAMNRIVCAPVTFMVWVYAAGSNTPLPHTRSMFAMGRTSFPALRNLVDRRGPVRDLARGHPTVGEAPVGVAPLADVDEILPAGEDRAAAHPWLVRRHVE